MNNEFDDDELLVLCKQVISSIPIQIKRLNSLDSSSSSVVWHLQMSDGKEWVVKLLNKCTWLGKLDIKCIKQTQIWATYVTKHLGWLSSHNVKQPMGFTTQYRHTTLLFSRFLPGIIVPVWSKQQMRRLGALLAYIHTLRLPKERGMAFPPIKLSNHGNLKDFANIISTCNEHRLHKFNDWIISHRDVHSANVVWKTQTIPTLIDWASAGLIHPFVELIGLAVNGAGIARGEFDEAGYIAVIRGYCNQAGTLPADDETLWLMCLHSWLLWLVHNDEMSNTVEMNKTISSITLLLENMERMKVIYRKRRIL